MDENVINFSDKLAICYTCCGPTYRKSVLDKMNSTYFDHPNLYYFIITDDKEYFKDLTKENLVINELTDFYDEFPDLKKYEAFLESDNGSDYAEKFIKTNYKFPFSTMRFHLKQCEGFGITNVALLCTDTDINFSRVDAEFFEDKNKIYNAVSAWYISPPENNTDILVQLLHEMGYSVDETIMVFDAAARLFVLESVDKMMEFFRVWNDVIVNLYKKGEMIHYIGGYARNDEYILAPVYNALKISRPDSLDAYVSLFNVKHNSAEERPWAHY